MADCNSSSVTCDGVDTLFLPLFPYEDSWNKGLRGFLYFCGLLYCFIGVSIVADVFMGSIEKITSKTRKIYLSKENSTERPDFVEIPIWNGTVANLTLMALGSSAPEILLAIIEIVKNNFEAGELGPGTIVGSAAFNLLAITAVCVVAIPNGEGRSIHLIKVFWVTSVFSFFAYVWLLIVLEFITPGVVDLWEAILTLLFFPILVILAWWADRDFKFGKRKTKGSGQEDRQIELGAMTVMEGRPGQTFYNGKGDLDKEELIAFYKDLRKYPYLTEQDAVTLAAAKLMESQPRSRLWYRIGAVRNFVGSKKVNLSLTKKLQVVYDAINSHPEVAPTTGPRPILKTKSRYPPDISIVEFRSATFAVPENVGNFKVTVIRHGRMDNTVRVRVESFDGTAKQGSDYVPVDEQVVFEPNIREKEVTIKILDDDQWEPDEEFFLRLSLVDDGNQSLQQRGNVALGRLPIMEVIILDDDEPGVLSFRKRGLLVKESCGYASLDVERSCGADGEISVKWRTADSSAQSPLDYHGGEGTLVFKHGETLRNIDIAIIDDITPEKDKCFEVELFEPSDGATLGRITKIAVTISNDDDFNSVLQRWTELTAASLKTMQVHQESYRSQIYDAVTVNGGNIGEATDFDYFMHVVTFFWKVIFSLIPPPHLAGGWLCFCCSLVAIGILTAIIGDLATIFGCIVGLKDAVTAITFVALGTSLPDLFASKTAAAKEKYADNAIGNVTGSNSVNVFLGLGLPWVMAAIYHQAQGNKFKVNSGTIAFSVLIYSIVAFIALGLIIMRRYLTVFGKTELGGPTGSKWASGALLLVLWISYITLSSLQSYCIITFDI